MNTVRLMHALAQVGGAIREAVGELNAFANRLEEKIAAGATSSDLQHMHTEFMQHHTAKEHIAALQWVVEKLKELDPKEAVKLQEDVLRANEHGIKLCQALQRVAEIVHKAGNK